jgi:DNA-binding SARP family transcriptional activator
MYLQRAAQVENSAQGLPSEVSETVRVWVLGAFRVSVGDLGIAESEWRLRKATGLVKLLALTPQHRLNREQLMDQLWSDLAAKAAANNLRYALHNARLVLEPTLAAASWCLPRKWDARAAPT